MNTARERILGRLRHSAEATGRAAEAGHAGDFAPRPEREAAWQAKQPASGDTVEGFVSAVEAAGGRVIRATDWESLGEAILPWMREYQVRHAITGTEPRLKGLRKALANAGIEGRVYDAPQEEREALLFESDCGITTARGGIADTGSVILWPSPAEPRLLSLSVPIHLAIVERSELYPNLLGFLEEGGYAEAPPSNLVFVTGPSRTADIEQTLSIGVHGPKIFLVALVG